MRAFINPRTSPTPPTPINTHTHSHPPTRSLDSWNNGDEPDSPTPDYMKPNAAAQQRNAETDEVRMNAEKKRESVVEGFASTSVRWVVGWLDGWMVGSLVLGPPPTALPPTRLPSDPIPSQLISPPPHPRPLPSSPPTPPPPLPSSPNRVRASTLT